MASRLPVDAFTPNALAWLAQAEAPPPTGLSAVQEEAASAAFERLTEDLLKSRPANAFEALVLMEVVKAEVDNGGRSDRLDVQALANVQAWLADEMRCDPLPVSALVVSGRDVRTTA